MGKLTALLLVALLGFVVADFEFPRTHDVKPDPTADRYSDAVGEYYVIIDQSTLTRIDCTNVYEFCTEATMTIPQALGTVYGILGFDNEDYNDFAIIFGQNMIALYNAVDNDIVDEQAININLEGSALFIAGNKIVFAKGPMFVVYDAPAPAGSRVYTLPALPTVHADAAIAVLPNKLFVAGGKVESDAPQQAFSSDMFYIDISTTGTWERADLSQARSNIGAIGYGSQVFFAGGVFLDSTFESVSSVVDIWNDAINDFDAPTEIDSLGRANIVAVANDNKVLLVGGDLKAPTDATYKQGSDMLDVYDITTKQFTSLQMSSPRVKYSVAFTGSSIAIAGGLNPETKLVLATVEVYETKSGSLSTIEMSQARLFNDYIHGGAIGIHDESIFVYGGRLGPDSSSGVSNRLDMFDRSLLAITALSTGLSNLREQVFDLTSGVQEQIGYIEGQYQSAAARLDSLNASVSFIDALENQILELDSKVEENNQIVTVTVEDLKTSNADLKKQVAELTATLKKLQDSIKPACLTNALTASGACEEPSSSKNNTGTIVAAVVGSIVGVALLAGLTYYFVRRNKLNRGEPLLNIHTINA